MTDSTLLQPDAAEGDTAASPQLVAQTHNTFGKLLKRCEGLAPVTCAVVHPCDRDSLLGPLEAAKRKLIVPVLVGPVAKIRAVAAAEKVDLSPYRLVASEHRRVAAWTLPTNEELMIARHMRRVIGSER
jgi:hypothetical protein